MMSSANMVEAAVHEAIDEFNQLESGHVSKSHDAILFGREGSLDSFGLVTFVLTVEEKVNQRLGASVALADEKAMSRANSPFRTIESLVHYIQELINEAE